MHFRISKFEQDYFLLNLTFKYCPIYLTKQLTYNKNSTFIPIMIELNRIGFEAALQHKHNTIFNILYLKSCSSLW